MSDNSPKAMSGASLDLETGEDQVYVSRPRNCYALEQLIAEVADVFPETTVETMNPTPRGVSMAALLTNRVDLDFVETLLCIDGDDRLLELDVHSAETENQVVYAEMRVHPRWMDSREPFGVKEAYEVICGE